MGIATGLHRFHSPAATRREPRIAIVAERRYLAQRQPAGLAATLVANGHAVAVLEPRDAAASRLLDLDLLVARGRDAALLDALALAESLGIATLNRRAAIEAVLDKASMARALAAAGLPTPPTRVGAAAEIAAGARAADFPLVVKPVLGDNARGVRVVRSRCEVEALPADGSLLLAQPLLSSDGFDLKLYAVGPDVFAVRKRSPIAPGPPTAYRVETTPALRALALRCGALFGLTLFGVDCIETPQGPVVIEVNDFPNYSGVDGADACLARYVLGRARRDGGGAER